MDAERFAHAWVHAMNQRDLEMLTSLADPDLEVHFLELPGGGVWGGDFKPVYHGVEGAIRFIEPPRQVEQPSP